MISRLALEWRLAGARRDLGFRVEGLGFSALDKYDLIGTCTPHKHLDQQPQSLCSPYAVLRSEPPICRRTPLCKN